MSPSTRKARRPTSSIIRLWKRPVFWTAAVVATAAYWDPVALRGPFVYDDVASILNNDVVLVKVPWYEAFSRDFWGKPMIHPASHKSYRPITSLTLRLNMIVSILDGTAGTPDHTYYFHVVNVILHALNTGLVTEVAAMVFGDETLAPPMIAGILFGIHPVHAEAVSNITSRGELLMTLFYLLAFLSYAKHIPTPPPTEVSNRIPSNSEPNDNDNDEKEKENPSIQSESRMSKSNNDASAIKSQTEQQSEKSTANDNSTTNTATQQNKHQQQRIKDMVCLYFVPFLCMALSIFSKEQGATTLCSLVAFDFIRHHESVKSFCQKLRRGDQYSLEFLERTFVLAVQTLLLVGLRFWLNGESSPDFVEEQNPAGFARDRFTRVFSVNWTYCLYLRDMVFPLYLAPDWSGHGIPLIESIDDDRVFYVVLLWVGAFATVYSLIMGSLPFNNHQRTSQKATMIRHVVLISLIAFLFLPFLLSSNLLITTGFAKADRVIYFPLFGYCLLQGLLFKVVSDNSSISAVDNDDEESLSVMLMYIFLTLEFAFFGLKTNERNLAWADEYTLWKRAYQVNPRSFHTMGNAGRMLAKAGEYVEAEKVLRPIKDVRTNNGNPNDTFLYTVALSKMNRCEESFKLIDDAIQFLLEEREEGGIRYDPAMSFHSQSSLMISRAFCTDDVMEKGRIMQEAVTLDLNNNFAKEQFQNYLDTLQRMQEAMRMQQMGMDPEQMMDMQQQLMQLQQGGKPRNEEELRAMQQFIMHQQMLKQQQQEQQQQMQQMQKKRQKQQQQQQQRSREGQPTPKHTGPTEMQKPPERKEIPVQNEAIPQNLGLPPQASQRGFPKNLGLPPIEDFENGEFENMFFN